VTDPESRGLLDETLRARGTEFVRLGHATDLAGNVM